jgi:hypothetical protein
LLARPDNHLLISQLVDTFNNIVQYQHEGNTHLLYSIVLKKHCVERVRALRSGAQLRCVWLLFPFPLMRVHSLACA